ncbi:MAG: tetratricopeptide repeat protein [Terrimicrobiaceae bacterium]
MAREQHSPLASSVRHGDKSWMPGEQFPEKKGVIRPRVRQAGGDELPAAEGEEDLETRFDVVQKNRLRASGVKFPARSVAVPKRSRSESSVTVEPETDKEVVPVDEPAAPIPAAEGEDLWAMPSPPKPEPATEPADPQKRTRRKKKRTIWTRRFRLRKMVVPVLLAVVSTAILFFWIGKWLGLFEAASLATRERVSLRPEFVDLLESALTELRTGDAAKAVSQLSELEEANPNVGSLTYLHALAALQNGDIELAERKSNESIAKSERVSDCLSIKAVLATQRASTGSFKLLGDPNVRSEQFLRQAMMADSASPFPMVELGTLLRYQGKNEEALALLKGARTRLNPVDSHTVIDVSIALMTLQETPDEKLPRDLDPQRDLVAGFSAAYVALRTGNAVKAAEILKICQQRMSPDLFDYLVNDPAIRRYKQDPALKVFFP